MRKTLFFILLFNLGLWVDSPAQVLQPGFKPDEYREILKILSVTARDSLKNRDMYPRTYSRIYRSQPMGLDNLWELWQKDRVAVVSIRGTTKSEVSWLANLYAAMVPATGDLQITDSIIFQYNLAENPRASVHIGWLISTAFLAQEIVPTLDSLDKAGIRDVIIAGHSQGGAISYLLTSYLYSLQTKGDLSSDIQFKTYASASPKPGNLYYAYDYEFKTQGGWTFNVVNTVDWVPEVPFSIQTINDFNAVNPIAGAKEAINKQSFFKRLIMRRVYRKMVRPMNKAQKNFEKYLGEKGSKTIKKKLKEYKKPEWSHNNNFVRTGQTIILMADEEYAEEFPDSDSNFFVHHDVKAYLFLLDKQYKGQYEE
ncbi:MAG TPA: lipase family protein [Sphingobacterium sp.]|nr:lipase family protein [Sphingobacterium sp.]